MWEIGELKERGWGVECWECLAHYECQESSLVEDRVSCDYLHA